MSMLVSQGTSGKIFTPPTPPVGVGKGPTAPGKRTGLTEPKAEPEEKESGAGRRPQNLRQNHEPSDW